jgi:hypothetical protein
LTLFAAGDLLEGGDRDVGLVGRVLEDVLDLASLDAAGIIDDLEVVLHAGVDADAGEGEDAGHRDRAADHDFFLRLCRRRQREAGGGEQGGEPLG